MSGHRQSEPVTLYHGDCLEVLRTLPDASVDAIVTDPPYGLGFMGKEWDALPPGLPWAQECLRVLKPGGHMLAFGGTRTWHRLACAVEDAGFEVRDSIAWMYGSGFPKSLNLTDEDGERTGWGTALKPAFEPIVVARKPLVGTVATNVLAHGTGALNVNGCRIDGKPRTTHADGNRRTATDGPTLREGLGLHDDPWPAPSGRWPANVILDESQAAALDEQSAHLHAAGNQRESFRADGEGRAESESGAIPTFGSGPTSAFNDSGGASRFFYVAKADASERVRINGTAHPTVKPLALMRWLARLVTPPGGTVLEPFAGSGTTVEACILEGFHCIAIEREADYLPLIQQRIDRRTDPVAAVKATGEDEGLFGLLGGDAA